MLHTVHRPSVEAPPATGPVLCRTCAVPMTTDASEAGDRATTRWHSCPVCRHRRMTCEPDALGTAGRARDDDRTVAASEAELH